MAYIGIDLAQIDRLIDALSGVQQQVDDIEFDLARARHLSELHPGVALQAAAFGHRCDVLGNVVRLRSSRLRTFRPRFGSFAGGTGIGWGGTRSGSRPESLSLSSQVRKRVRDIQQLDDRGRSRYRALRNTGQTHDDAMDRLRAIDDTERLLAGAGLIGGDSETFGPGELQLTPDEMTALISFLARFSDLVRLIDDESSEHQRSGRVGDQRSDFQRQGGAISLEALFNIVDDPDLDPGVRQAVLLLLSTPTLLEKLDGAAQREGDLLGELPIDGDLRYSIADITALLMQDAIAAGLGRYADQIDVAHEGPASELDGINSQKDYEAILGHLADCDPGAAFLVELALENGYYVDSFGADDVAAIASNIGVALAVVSLIVVATGGSPLVIAALAAASRGAAGVELAAGIVDDDPSAALAGLVGIVAPEFAKAGAGVFRRSLTGQAVQAFDDLGIAYQLLGGARVPIEVAADGTTALSRLGLDIADQSVITIVDGLADLSADASPSAVAAVTNEVFDTALGQIRNGMLPMGAIVSGVNVGEVVDGSIGLGLAKSSSSLGDIAATQARRNEDETPAGCEGPDEADESGPDRPQPEPVPTPVATPATPAPSSSASAPPGAGTAPAPTRTPVAVGG